MQPFAKVQGQCLPQDVALRFFCDEDPSHDRRDLLENGAQSNFLVHSIWDVITDAKYLYPYRIAITAFAAEQLMPIQTSDTHPIWHGPSSGQ